MEPERPQQGPRAVSPALAPQGPTASEPDSAATAPRDPSRARLGVGSFLGVGHVAASRGAAPRRRPLQLEEAPDPCPVQPFARPAATHHPSPHAAQPRGTATAPLSRGLRRPVPPSAHSRRDLCPAPGRPDMDGPHVCPGRPSGRTATLTRGPRHARRGTAPFGSDSQGGAEAAREPVSPGRDEAGRGQEQRRGQPRTLRSRTRQGASFPGPPAAPGGPGALTHARTGPSRAGHPVACSACPVNQSPGCTGQKRAERSEGSRERGSRGHWRHGLSGAPAAVAPPADASGDEQQSRAHRGGRGAGRHAAAHTGARALPTTRCSAGVGAGPRGSRQHFPGPARCRRRPRHRTFLAGRLVAGAARPRGWVWTWARGHTAGGRARLAEAEAPRSGDGTRIRERKALRPRGGFGLNPELAAARTQLASADLGVTIIELRSQRCRET